jgi:phage repressor protein C with HTH and peptisase S24 domain
MRRPVLVKVMGDSMRPTLLPGDRCVVTRYVVSDGLGIVIARPDPARRELVVKRIDRVHWLGDEDTVTGVDLVSDNRDAPDLADTPLACILGRVRFRYWPLSRIGWVR